MSVITTGDGNAPATCGACGEWQYGVGVVGAQPERDMGWCVVYGDRQRGHGACGLGYPINQRRPLQVEQAIREHGGPVYTSASRRRKR